MGLEKSTEEDTGYDYIITQKNLRGWEDNCVIPENFSIIEAT